ncbi:MAG TPA: ATP-binding protein, partial [Candidatus Dojkabacteria bacterium]
MTDNKVTLAELLRKNIKNLTYEEVVSFLKSNEPEGLHLDYKESTNEKSLRKHFAAFSNKKGGVIIIGVKEDKKTGIPIDIKGIKVDAKDIERINQIASNTDPLPTYSIHKVEDSGKGFIIIKIMEGATPPYFNFNDSKVYVRTGDITKDYLESAEPRELENLFSKKKNSTIARKNNQVFVNLVFESHLKSAERDRISLKASGDDVMKNKFGENSIFAKAIIQPSNPSEELFKPHDLIDYIQNNYKQVGRHTFPPTNIILNPIPNGVSGFFSDSRYGNVTNFQLLSNGLVYFLDDILREEGQFKLVEMHTIVRHLISTLRYANYIYNDFGYNGSITCIFEVDGFTGHEQLEELKNHQRVHQPALLPSYKLEFETNTVELNDSKQSNNLEVELTKQLN